MMMFIQTTLKTLVLKTIELKIFNVDLNMNDCLSGRRINIQDIAIMSFSIYQHNNVKDEVASIDSTNDSLEAISAILPLSSQIRRIETALLSLPFILDCVVTESATDMQRLERVAYVVSSEPLNPQQLHSQLQQILPTTPLPTTYIPLAALPLTATGAVNHQMLNTVEIDGDGVQNSFSCCFVDRSVASATINSDNTSSLPFYQKSWHVKPLTGERPQETNGQTLILIDQLGFASRVCHQLDQLGQPYIKVEPGSDFACLSSNHYYLNPVNPDHYQQLLESVVTDDLPVTQILHLWTYHESFRAIPQEKALEYSLDLGVHSLSFLAQALAATQGEQIPVRLTVGTNYSPQPQPSSWECCNRNPEIRFLQTLSIQQPWLRCCHLDLPESELTQNVDRMLQELYTIAEDVEVAYHQNQRLVAIIEPMQ